MEETVEILMAHAFEMTDHIKRERYVTDRGGDLLKEQANHILSEQLPEGIMEKLESYIGDGKATLTVGADLSTSVDFGCKAGAFTSVKVSCDNSMGAVQAVHDLIAPWVRETVEDDQAHVEKIRDKILNGGRDPSPAPPSKKKAASPKRPGFRR